MNPLLSGASRSLVEKTEKALSIQIKAELSPDLAVGSQARIQDMKETGVLVILLKPDRQDHQYLIAQGCMSALATQEAPFSLRSTGNGEAQFAQTLAERGIENAAALAKHLVTGTASQLRGAPLLALAAQRIYKEYPELRDDQLKYFKLDCAEGALALTQAPEKFDGALVNAHHAMNGAVALVADYLFQNTRFYEPFKGTPSDTLATQLVEDLYGVDVLETEQEIVSSWISKLSLSDFYRVVAD